MGRDQIPASSTPTTIKKILTTAGTEYNEVLSSLSGPTLKKVLIKSRTNNDMQFQWKPSAVQGDKYITIPAGQTYWDDGLDKPETTVYLVGTVNGQIAEIQIWN